MTFTAICAHCGSPDTQTGCDQINCLNCGERTWIDGGGAVPPDKKCEVPNPRTER